MPADYYLTLFKGRIPLERMIRRQIEGKEYIALSKTELDHLINNRSNTSQDFQEIYLIVPEIKMIRGYYATEMRKINLGSILNIEAKRKSHDDPEGNYTIQCSNHPSIALKTTHRFIRWLGL
jgi:hypothetical protein